MTTRSAALIAAAALATAGLTAAAAPAAAATTSPAAVAATPAAAAATPGCRAIRPGSGFYEGGRVASELLTVPDNARCTTISVKNIKDPANPADHCQTFLVGFFPAESEYEYTEPVEACSAGPGGPEVVLATNVPDGMPYRVLYEIDYLGQHLRYGVRH